ncbi:4-alpha-glucanotransferase [Xanthomonas sp. XNM01]|uniref:4-alpha-glucanotransferase n=1 Tax=Xanthomonas sp. XNM01 TaxID=2769289 RepID=UPI00178604CD|nr:4-alpha-glucanotransferase [Xanthomonas sp. XNM01]MBD9368416.1 4-alpha-glucanotransferase [Xanthomonas sp. XNM01]
MSLPPASLDTVAEAAGLSRHWTDVASRAQRVADDTLLAVLDAMDLPAATPAQCSDSLQRLASLDSAPALLTVQAGATLTLSLPAGGCRWEREDGQETGGLHDPDGHLRAPVLPGYWRLHAQGRSWQVAVAPRHCFGVADALDDADARTWGTSLQVYSARGDGDGGIGDTQGVTHWLQRTAARGGQALALSPVHATIEGMRHFSPYSPSDRRFLDPLQASPVQLFGDAARQVLASAPELELELARLQAMDLVDWTRARPAKWAWIDRLRMALPALSAELHDDYLRFAAEAPDTLRDFAAFAGRDTPEGDALQLFGQWLARRCWRHCQQQAHAQGMRIGLIADLAVGFDPQGAEAAAWPQAVLRGLELGAPPDAFNAKGQAWGIGGYSPAGLRATGFAPFIALLRAVMQDRGGVRIDHILGLQRLWVLPQGAGAGQGVYLRYPLEDLLNLLALESWRHRCIVIGEDLGVVPPGIRAQLAERGVLGIDVLQFTRDEHGAFLPPQRWRGHAVATTTTHDLPTTHGWLDGRDLAWRECLKTAEPAADSRRARDIARLKEAMAAAGVDSGDTQQDALRFTSASPARLALLPAEDALGLREQPNLPGTVDGHPNWRRRLPQPLPEAPLDAALLAFADGRPGARA